MENEFYLRDTRGNTGSSCMFWAEGGCGYTTNLDRSEVFSREEAQKYADRQYHFIPLSKSKVDAVATVRVDMQYLKINVDFSKGIIINRHPGSYDGNDIFFDDGDGGYTADYEKAAVYKSAEDVLNSGLTGAALSKVFLDSICRRTVQAESINHRKMITASGIKYQAPRKQRMTTGKTRGNCPCCGKITWDYNPYENAFCSSNCQYDFHG
jgi:hypothetical protein